MSPAAPFNITIAGLERRVAADHGQSIIEAAIDHDIVLPHDCRAGGCGTCRVRLIQGRVAYPDDELPMGLTPEEAGAGYILACQARPATDLVIEAPDGLVAALASRTCDAVVSGLTAVASDILHLRLDLPAIDFLPGQYANFHLPDGMQRSFSMASAPAGTGVDFYVRRLPGGRFTDRHLAALRPGDPIRLDLPAGSFRLHVEDYRPLLMVATGTGIAPIKAMLEALLDDEDCPPVSLYWGMRSEADLFLDAEIRRWAGRLYDFTYVPVLSRPQAGWAGRTGHVQAAVVADHADLTEHAVYLCGSPQMVHDAKRAFLGRGASAAHLYAESFTLQAPTSTA